MTVIADKLLHQRLRRSCPINRLGGLSQGVVIDGPVVLLPIMNALPLVR